MSTQEVLRDVPADRVEQVMAEFVAIGAAPSRIPQGDGTFTIVAKFSDTPQSPPAAEGSATGTTDPSAPVIGPATPSVNPSTRFSDLASEYRSLLEACHVVPSRAGLVKTLLSRLEHHAPRYRALGDELGIPWFFIGIVHSLESGSDFATHLHNGDPLTARTVHTPFNRPDTGSPPYTWEESAHDALKEYVGQTDWSPARMLYRWETYNGFGYRARGLPSPYLWSFSQHYVKGRFVADHVFDADSVSKQCGAAVLLKALQQGMALQP